MKPENHPKDPIQIVAEKLREHAVPYKEGSWERFKEMEKKNKKIVLLPYFSAAAAVLLIAFTLFMMPNESKNVFPELAKQESINQQVESNTSEEPLKEDVFKEQNRDNTIILRKESRNVQANATNLIASQSSEKKIEVVEKEGSGRGISEKVSELAANSSTSNQIDERENSEIILSTILNDPGKLQEKTEKSAQGSRDFLTELLKMEKEEALALSIVDDKKWSVGIDFAPNMSSNNQVNMGGGVAVAYAVSPKISLSSGVSYLHVNAERGNVNEGMQSSPAIASDALPLAGRRSSKTLSGVDASLVGLDIPLTINYHISPSIYASAGVSVFNVLSERQDNIYENSSSEVLFIASDAKRPEPVVQTYSSRERAADKNYEGKGLSGFYNFSLGYALPVSSKVGIAIEPFYKIPMGSSSGNELNLSNGGIKVSTRF